MYDIYRPANTPYAALLDTTLDSAEQASAQLKKAGANYKPAVQYPQTPLATGLRLLAELIDSGTVENRLRVGQVTLTGFDTHTSSRSAWSTPHPAQRRPQRLLERPHRPRPRRTTCWS